MRGTSCETDFVFPHDLSLFGLSLAGAVLLGYGKEPKVICPAAASGRYILTGYDMLILLFIVEVILFIIGFIIAGNISKKDSQGRYKMASRWRLAFRVAYRNFAGFLALIAVVFVLLLGRF